jgi:hypothetical protein
LDKHFEAFADALVELASEPLFNDPPTPDLIQIEKGVFRVSSYPN